MGNECWILIGRWKQSLKACIGFRVREFALFWQAVDCLYHHFLFLTRKVAHFVLRVPHFEFSSYQGSMERPRLTVRLIDRSREPFLVVIFAQLINFLKEYCILCILGRLNLSVFFIKCIYFINKRLVLILKGLTVFFQNIGLSDDSSLMNHIIWAS